MAIFITFDSSEHVMEATVGLLAATARLALIFQPLQWTLIVWLVPFNEDQHQPQYFKERGLKNTDSN